MGAGLFSSLALTPAVASSILMGAAVPPAPEIPSQEIAEVHTSDATQAGQQKTVRYSSPSPASKDIASATSKESHDVSELLTGDEDSLGDESTPHGVDISGHQHGAGGEIDIPTVVNDGNMRFGFIKATEGTGFTNKHFRADVIKFREQNIPVGFYHYARPSSSLDDARQQAQFFIQRTGLDKGVKAFPPVLDLEEAEGITNPDVLIEWTRAFVDEVKSLTGLDTMIYTYPSFWQNEMGNTTEFSELPLWIAHYNNSSEPGIIPGGWDDWTFWQYTAKGSVEGYGNVIDMNVFNGSNKELRKLYESSGVNVDDSSDNTQDDDPNELSSQDSIVVPE